MLDKDKKHFLIEEHLFFTQYPFHKEKLVLHRASMKAHEQYLLQEGYQVQYIESTDALHDCRLLIDHLAKEKYAVIHMVDPVDYLLMRRIKKACTSNNIALQVSDSPSFLNTLTDADLQTADAAPRGAIALPRAVVHAGR